ncbi:MAG: tetratricopeptide repeat protein [Planctomycetota bacterium]
MAERPADEALDKAAFAPPREIKHASQMSRAQYEAGRMKLVTAGLDGALKPRVVERVIGVQPLRQFLIAEPGGRYQVAELAVDAAKNEWFDVFGTEDRQPGEWGHWTGRGMTWNSMCAACHNTSVRKNYKPAFDTYETDLAERGVGCEACHGPLAQHAAWQQAHAQSRPRPHDPFLRRFYGDTWLSVCGSCHSRRSELTGAFQPGDDFLDHFSPAIPDETDIYYPDGQVHDEDFEYASFLGSRMHGLGVRCMHCHDPHSGKVRASGNFLCLQCHGGKIDPDQHGHHKPGTPGSFCVDCHMPQTAYMQRHLRRDHGLTIPDPLLTKEHNIPNACSRCHADKGLAWNIDYATQWYGQKLDRHTQRRARCLARARAGAAGALGGLAKLAREETQPYWKAVAAGLLGAFCPQEEARDALLELTQHPEPLVRAVSARALGACAAEPAAGAALARLLADPVRLVRVEAAWALHAAVALDSPAGQDLCNFLGQSADQPAGLLQAAVFNLDRGQAAAALPLLRRAISWDGRSAPLRQTYATALSLTGDCEEAVRQLDSACRTEPRNAALRFDLGLALGEAGDTQRACKTFREAVALDPRLARAWYNLGLAASHLGDPAEAVQALQRAEALEPHNADFSYALATVQFNAGKPAEARAAAERALRSNKTHAGALELLKRLEGQK